MFHPMPAGMATAKQNNNDGDVITVNEDNDDDVSATVAGDDDENDDPNTDPTLLLSLNICGCYVSIVYVEFSCSFSERHPGQKLYLARPTNGSRWPPNRRDTGSTSAEISCVSFQFQRVLRPPLQLFSDYAKMWMVRQCPFFPVVINNRGVSHPHSCLREGCISKVPDQNAVSGAWYIVEIHHSGRKSWMYFWSVDVVLACTENSNNRSHWV